MATKRMLIDSSHAEETRVVVATGTRLDEFDFETSTRKQLKGNIYLAKVTRVEPSLQAAFVDYGGNRHGFLPFGEIHPDYYQIPVSDREALFREQEAAAAAEEEYDEAEARSERNSLSQAESHEPGASELSSDEQAGQTVEEGEFGSEQSGIEPHGQDASVVAPPDTVEAYDLEPADPVDSENPEAWDIEPQSDEPEDEPQPMWAGLDAAPAPQLSRPAHGEQEGGNGAPYSSFETQTPPASDAERFAESGRDDEGSSSISPWEGDDVAPLLVEPVDAPDDAVTMEPPASEEAYAAPAIDKVAARDTERDSVEEVGGDEVDDVERRRSHVSRSLLSRRYKIQEVIKKRQIMLVQVVKEERGTKGAALTTYLSLAGRYCVLMPNAVRGGGISRKIVNAEDRRRLKAITAELEVPSRMGLIVRTAGMNRTKAEIKRDFEYLMRQWESIRELTLSSTAPCLIYGEANLIRRSIRDLYAKEIDEILVEGDEGYRIAKDFMRTLIPSHTSKVQPYRDRVPLFVRYQIESQLDSMYSPHVQLRSGGYLVINQAEALVAIDVNSGRSTRERNIEETATRTNLEAADEIARQLRLRDLAGLIVIDFIDMDEGRNQRAVERRLKEALKTDRARIQVGRISAFGLLEMSRQRLRPSLAETSMETCPSCGGAGLLRSTESAALHVLRAIEEEGLRGRAAEIRVHVPTRVAMYVLNHKRQALADIEARYDFVTAFVEDNTLVPPGHEIERIRARSEGPSPIETRSAAPINADMTDLPAVIETEAEEVEPEDELAAAETESAVERTEEAVSAERRSSRRRRRPRGDQDVRGRPKRDDEQIEAASAPDAGEPTADAAVAEDAEERETEASGDGAEDDGERGARRRRRGRRGGRRRRGRTSVTGGETELSVASGEAIEEEAQDESAPTVGGAADESDGRERSRRGRRGRRAGRRGVHTGGSVGTNGEAAAREIVGDMEAVTAREAEHEEPSRKPTAWTGAPPPSEIDLSETQGGAGESPAAAVRGAETEGETHGNRLVAQPMEDRAEEETKDDAEETSFEAAGGRSQAPNPPRRGWWQRVLTGR